MVWCRVRDRKRMIRTVRGPISRSPVFAEASMLSISLGNREVVKAGREGDG